MLKPGLCSISFRKHSVDEVIEFARAAGIEGIEWGGDVHLPPGDLALAHSVREKTEAAGLVVSSYGSYYRADREEGPFSAVLETAAALDAPVIRVWAGRRGSADADESYRTEVADCLRQAAAAARGKTLP